MTRSFVIGFIDWCTRGWMNCAAARVLPVDQGRPCIGKFVFLLGEVCLEISAEGRRR